jgi:hypothetical protein
MKKIINSFLGLAPEFGTLIHFALSILKTILKWLLFACSVLSVLGISFAMIFNETYNEPLAAGGAVILTVIYTVYMFISLEL